jgi:hypothetical protein
MSPAKEVHLASLNFSAIYDGEHGLNSMGQCADRFKDQCVYATDGDESSELVMTVTSPDWKMSEEWKEKAAVRTFPELELSTFLQAEYEEEMCVYTFNRVGPVLLRKAYAALIKRLGVDLIGKKNAVDRAHYTPFTHFAVYLSSNGVVA